jgi:hypothetical protein
MRIFNLGTLTSSDSRQITALLGCWSFHGEGFDWAGPFWCVLYVTFEFMPDRSSPCFAQPDDCRNNAQLSARRRFPLHRRAWSLTAQADNDLMRHTWIREVPESNFGQITGYPDRSRSCFARPLQANVGTVHWNRPRLFPYLLDT